MKTLIYQKKVKIVRHQDKRCNFYKLVLYNQIETYQSYQGKHIFNCDFIISFIGIENTKAVFYGIYEVCGSPSPAKEYPLPNDFIFQEMVNYETDIYYHLKRVHGFEDYENRVVIEWGKGTLAWNQHLSPKEVTETLPKGITKSEVINYEKFYKEKLGTRAFGLNAN